MVDFTDWHNATAALEPGVQRAFIDVLTLASEGKTTLNYRADNYGGGACLVNQARNMLANTQNGESPMQAFRDVVSAFDTVNYNLRCEGVNESDRFVSPLAAEVLLRNFGPLKPMVIEITSDPAAGVKPENIKPQPFTEPSDDDLLNDWLTAMQTPAPEASAPVLLPEQDKVTE